MTDMTRDEIVSNLKKRMDVDDAAGAAVDLIGKKYAFMIAMEAEEVNDDAISKLQSMQGRKELRLMVAIPPNSTILTQAREKLQGTGIGIIDGRGFILKPFTNSQYISVTIGP